MSVDAAETEMPVAVVTVNCNHAAYLPAYLESLAASRPPPAEIIVVDNASTDDSLAVLARYPQVTVIHNACNVGYSAALNQAFARATAPLVCATGPDVIVEPDWLERLLEAFRQNPRHTFAVGSRILTLDRRQVQYAGGSLHFTGHLVVHQMWAPHDAAAPVDLRPRETGAVDSTSMLVDRKKYLAIGGCDSDFFVYHEEYDWGQRARMRGWSVRYAPASVVYHGTGTAEYSVRGTGAYPKARPFLHTRNRLLSIFKNHQARTLVAAAPALMVVELLNWAVLARMGLGAEYRRAWQWLWRNRAATARKRRTIQRRRRVSDREVLAADPLTFSPAVAGSPFLRVAQRALDGVLGAYWAVVRRLIYAPGGRRRGRARR